MFAFQKLLLKRKFKSFHLHVSDSCLALHPHHIGSYPPQHIHHRSSPHRGAWSVISSCRIHCEPESNRKKATRHQHLSFFLKSSPAAWFQLNEREILFARRFAIQTKKHTSLYCAPSTKKFQNAWQAAFFQISSRAPVAKDSFLKKLLHLKRAHRRVLFLASDSRFEDAQRKDPFLRAERIRRGRQAVRFHQSEVRAFGPYQLEIFKNEILSPKRNVSRKA